MSALQLFDEHALRAQATETISMEPLSFPVDELGRLVDQVRRHIEITSSPPADDGAVLRARVASFLQRMLLRAGRFLALRQEACNRALLELAFGLTGVLADAHERAEQRLTSWNRRLESQDRFAQEIRQEVGRCHLELRSLERKIFSRIESQTHLRNREIPSASAHDFPDEVAAAWEDHLFGSRLDLLAALRSVAEPALSRLRVPAPARLLDLASGRGEWLSLVGERGLATRGIEANPYLADQCAKSGVNAKCGGILQVLQSEARSSFGCLTMARDPKMPDYSAWSELLDHCLRVLEPDGCMLLLFVDCRTSKSLAHGQSTPWLHASREFLQFLTIRKGFVRPDVFRLAPVALTSVSSSGGTMSDESPAQYPDHGLLVHRPI